MEPGIHDIPAAEYHALTGMFSRSVGHTLIEATALHALAEAEDPDEAGNDMDLGSAIHSKLLGKGADIAVVAADDWRKKASQAAKEDARAAGMIPLLTKQAEALDAAVTSARGFIATSPVLRAAFAAGRPERVMVWRAGEVMNRAMVDWMPNDPRAALVDVKTTGIRTSAQAWSRQAVNMGYDMQAALYTEGAHKVGRQPQGFLFLLIEQKPPYACLLMGAAPSLIELGRRRVDRSRAAWRECVATGNWPGHPPIIHWADAPGWALMQEEEADARVHFLHAEGRATKESVARRIAIEQRLGGPIA